MPDRQLNILGMGIVTDSITHITELFPKLQKAGLLDPSTVSSHDALTQLALRAAHQAWTMANLENSDPEKTALLMQTEWGAIDSTVAYLDSMLDSDGRYASPRHFSRSVYSSIASAAAIHFKIKGPCETLTFNDSPIRGSLIQAWRLLQTQRAGQVVLIWGEQNGDFASGLAKMAANKLKIRKYQRYFNTDLGSGAVALVVGSIPGLVTLDLNNYTEPPPPHPSAKPFAMDAAVSLLLDIRSQLPRL